MRRRVRDVVREAMKDGASRAWQLRRGRCGGFLLAIERNSSIFVPFDQARSLCVCPLRLEI